MNYVSAPVTREAGRRHPFLGFGLGAAGEAGRFYEPPQRRADPAETERRYRRYADPGPLSRNEIQRADFLDTMLGLTMVIDRPGARPKSKIETLYIARALYLYRKILRNMQRYSCVCVAGCKVMAVNTRISKYRL